MFKLEDISRDQQGRALGGIAVSVLDNTTGLAVTIYEDDDTTPKTNPLTSDSNGYCSCRVPAGTYKLSATYNGQTITRTAITVADTATSGSITFTATDKLLGRQSSGGGAGEEITCTAAGRALLDDSTAGDQRNTLGLGSIATQSASSVSITGGTITGITDLEVADGGTGASTASGARTKLGLVIGTNVQAYNAGLASFAAVAGSATADKLAYFTAANTLAETGLTSAGRALIDDATASDQRTTLGLGTMATQSASSVAITGGSIALSVGSVTTPSLTWGSDADTGFSWISSNTVVLSSGGTTLKTWGSGVEYINRFGNAPQYIYRRANGTESSTTRVVTDDSLGAITLQGWYDNGAGGTGWDSSAQIQAFAAEDYDATNTHGSYITFRVTPIGSTTITTRARLDPYGTLVMADSTGHSAFTGGTIRPRLQGYATTISNTALASTTYANSASAGGSLYLGHTRATAVDTWTAVQSDDILGRIAWEGADGTDMAQAVVLRGYCDGTVGANQVPGRLEVHTANSAGTLTKALTIDKSQNATLVGYLLEAGIFAGIHCHDASTAQSINNGTTYVKMTGFTSDSAAANCTPDSANDKITITIAGHYRICWQLSCTSGTANVTWKVAAFLGGTELDEVHAQQKITGAGDSQSMSVCAIVDVPTVPVDLDLRCRHDYGSAVNITPVYMTLTAQYVGAT